VDCIMNSKPHRNAWLIKIRQGSPSQKAVLHRTDLLARSGHSSQFLHAHRGSLREKHSGHQPDHVSPARYKDGSCPLVQLSE
jgi:hypothetical protein